MCVETRADEYEFRLKGVDPRQNPVLVCLLVSFRISVFVCLFEVTGQVRVRESGSGVGLWAELGLGDVYGAYVFFFKLMQLYAL